MNTKNQPAFPCDESRTRDGLTKLEWFAGMALQGILAGESEDFCAEPKANVESACDYAEMICAELERRNKP